MPKTYYRTEQMANGGPFRCYNCNKLLAAKISGTALEIDMDCPRCHAKIHITMNEPIVSQETLSPDNMVNS